MPDANVYDLVHAISYLLAAGVLAEWGWWHLRHRDEGCTDYDHIIISSLMITMALDRLRLAPHHVALWLGYEHGLAEIVGSTPLILAVNLAVLAVWSHAIHSRWERRRTVAKRLGDDM